MLFRHERKLFFAKLTCGPPQPSVLKIFSCGPLGLSFRRKFFPRKNMSFCAVFYADSENDTHFAIWTRFGKENRSQYLIFMKKRKKSADFWVFRVLFGHKGKLFSQTFYSHFVELEKLYNICESQLGPALHSKKLLWNIENFSLKN